MQPVQTGNTRVNSTSPSLIFSINSGRSGSQYLAQLLGTARKVVAFHEADPSMSGLFLQMVCAQGLAATLEARKVKADAILQTLSMHSDGTVYAETNHMFIKTFYDVVLERFGAGAVQVIRLRRHLPSVLKSFISMGYFSDRNRVWPAWMHLPGYCESAFIPPPLDRSADQYDLAIGYLLDIESRSQRFQDHYPDCKVHHIMLESLQSMDQATRLLETLNLEPTAATRLVVGQTINERNSRKAQIGIATTLEYCDERIQDYLQTCRARGIPLPASVA